MYRGGMTAKVRCTLFMSWNGHRYGDSVLLDDDEHTATWVGLGLAEYADDAWPEVELPAPRETDLPIGKADAPVFYGGMSFGSPPPPPFTVQYQTELHEAEAVLESQGGIVHNGEG